MRQTPSDVALMLARMIVRDAGQEHILGPRRYEPDTIVEIARALLDISVLEAQRERELASALADIDYLIGRIDDEQFIPAEKRLQLYKLIGRK